MSSPDRPSSRTVPLAVVLALAACASPPQSAPPLELGAAPLPSDRLAHAFRFVENADDGSQRLIDPGRQLAQVDYRSRLDVVPDRMALLALRGDSDDLLPPLGPEEKRRLDLLKAAAGLADQLHALAADLDARRTELDPSAPPRSVSADEDAAATRALVERERVIRQEVLAQVDALVAADVASRLAPGTPASDAEITTRTGALRRDAAGAPIVVDVARTRDLLEESVRDLEHSLERDRGLLAADATSLRLRALLHTGSKVVPVHIENYDTLDTWGTKEPSVGLGTVRDHGRTDAESLALRALAGAGTDRDGRRVTVASLSAGVAAALPAALAAARAGAGAADAAALDRLAALAARLDVIAGSLVDARGAATGDVGVQELPRAIEALRAWTAEARAAHLADAATALARPGPEPAGARAAALAADWPVALDRLDLATSFASARVLEMPIVGAAASIDPRTVPRPEPPMVPGSIDLNATIADRGDQLELILELLRGDGGEADTFPTARRTFEVERLRLVNSLSADVAFVRQSSEGHFRPAPAAAWTIHYRIPSEPDDSWLTRFWQVLDPGVGLSATAMSTDQESFQAGIGPHLSLFHDIVRGGWGYNLSADSNRGYVFVSIGIFETIQGIGTLMTGRFGVSAPGSKK
jgi:hypothetical protein